MINRFAKQQELQELEVKLNEQITFCKKFSSSILAKIT